MPRDRSYPPLTDSVLAEPLPSPIVDGHTHIEPAQTLAETPLNLTEQIERAAQVGVSHIVQCGCDLESARWTARVAVRQTAIVGAIAIHPNEVPRLAQRGEYEAGLAEIAQLARGEDRIRAIGETGLDYYRTGPQGHAIQLQAFRDHIALAKELGLALQIHDRDAHSDILATLKADGAPERTVFHCFSGDREMAEYVGQQGWYISLAGTLTFAGNDQLCAVAAVAPADRLLVETDAPYLTPQPFRGRPNAPYLAALTVRKLAQVRGVELAEICQTVFRNAQAAYGAW